MKKSLLTLCIVLSTSNLVAAEELPMSYSLEVTTQERLFLLELLEMSYTGKTTDKQRKWLDKLYAKVKGSAPVQRNFGKKQGGVNELGNEPEVKLDYEKLEVPE